jgi:hypothetical protein
VVYISVGSGGFHRVQRNLGSSAVEFRDILVIQLLGARCFYAWIFEEP